MRFDLHVHTTASDGTRTPSEIVHEALAKRLRAVAITDHDTVDGVREALPASAALHATGLLVIPGIELSAVHDGRDVHILGYFVDIDDETFLSRLSGLREARLKRAKIMVEALRVAGYTVSLDHVLDLSAQGSVGRSHIARALVQQGYAADVSEAFERLLGRGQPFYVPKAVQSPAEVLHAIRDAGGVAVLAHPGVTGVDDLIIPLAQHGLAGLEVYHPDHDDEQRAHYAALAADLGLCATGGTDYHGPQAPGPPLGSLTMPATALTTLLDLAAGRSDNQGASASS